MKLMQFITIMMFLLQSCEDSNEQPCCNVDVTFQIEIIDPSGNDLLNPNFNGSFHHSEISYYRMDENKNKIELTLKNNFIIPPSNGTSRYLLNITELGTKLSDKNYLSYLKLANNIIDTIKVRTVENNGNTYKDKIWYNDQLVWEKIDLNSLPIIITKDSR